ncbi:hypothetical protein [Hymenobacter edaphi]|uniref:hypothetical protein n=1 Tax=Hymenobacter edaphi TaxID=2211146 RepID=UPI0014040338|nr:hypothetical protein [Hymenobacter edaphi]
MPRFEFLLLVLSGLLLGAGTWLLAGQPGATTPILLGLLTLSAGVARYRHRRPQRG